MGEADDSINRIATKAGGKCRDPLVYQGENGSNLDLPSQPSETSGPTSSKRVLEFGRARSVNIRYRLPAFFPPVPSSFTETQ